jgi:hypothetical protein
MQGKNIIAFSFVAIVISVAVVGGVGFSISNTGVDFAVPTAEAALGDGGGGGGCGGCGGGDSSRGGDHETVTTTQPRPVCTLTVTPASINKGGSVTLKWTTTYATSVSINQGAGTVALDGSKVMNNITTSRTYTLTATGPGGTVTCKDSVTVNVPTPAKPVCTLTADPKTVDFKGNTELEWTTTNANAVSINQGIGSVALDGTHSVGNLTATKTFTLTATGAGGTVTCNVTVTVEAEPEKPSCDIWASPKNVDYGDDTTLHWTSENADSASLNQGIGSVGLNGTYAVHNITSDKTYILTVTGEGGTATCSETITVEEEEAPSCDLNASDNYIEEGDSVRLTWSSTNADSANLTDYGSVSLNGSRTVYPTRTTTYVFTVYGSNDDVERCEETIVVDDEEEEDVSCWIDLDNESNGRATLSWGSDNANTAYITSVGTVSLNGVRTVYPYDNQMYTLTVYGDDGSATCRAYYEEEEEDEDLSCDINASPSNITKGQYVYLSWDSEGARSAWISQGVGSVSTNGALSVRPDSSRTYTLTVTDYDGDTETCDVYVGVSDYPYISLTQIPYTGFGDPMSMVTYWAAILIVALAGGYAIVYYRPEALALVATAIRTRVAEEKARFVESAQALTRVAAVPRALTTDRMVLKRSGSPRISIIRD